MSNVLELVLQYLSAQNVSSVATYISGSYDMDEELPELPIWLTLGQVLLRLWFPTVMLHQTASPALTHTLRTLGRSHVDCERHINEAEHLGDDGQ